MGSPEKDLVWLHGRITTPPFTQAARVEAGLLLRKLHGGERLSMPHSRPMPSIGPGCHELRIRDQDATWRIFYFIDSDAIVLLDVTDKKTRETPPRTLQTCRARLTKYKLDRASR